MVINIESTETIPFPRMRHDSGTSSTLDLTSSVLSTSLPANVNLAGLDEVPAELPITDRRNGLYPKVDITTELPRPRVSSLHYRDKPSVLGKRRIRNKLRDMFKRNSSKNNVHNMESYHNGGLNGLHFGDSIDGDDLDLEEPGSGGQRSRLDSRGDSRSGSSASTRRDSEDSASSHSGHSGRETPTPKGHRGPSHVMRKLHEKALDILDKLGLATMESFDSTVTTEHVTAAQLKVERDHAREIIEAFTEFGQVTASTEPEEMDQLGTTHVLPAYSEVPDETEVTLRPVCSTFALEAAETLHCVGSEKCPFYEYLTKEKTSGSGQREVPVPEVPFPETEVPCPGIEAVNYENPYRYRSVTNEMKRKR